MPEIDIRRELAKTTRSSQAHHAAMVRYGKADGEPTQCQMVLRHLVAGKTLTALEALSKFGILALSQRCTELKNEGHDIRSEMITVANGKRVARYSIVLAA